MIDHLLRTPCSITNREQTVDEWGQPQNAAAGTVDTTCYLEPLSADEQLTGQNTGRVDVRIFLPAGTAIDRSSAITVAGRTYEVVAEPAVQTRPDESVSHVEALCRAAS